MGAAELAPMMLPARRAEAEALGEEVVEPRTQAARWVAAALMTQVAPKAAGAADAGASARSQPGAPASTVAPVGGSPNLTSCRPSRATVTRG